MNKSYNRAYLRLLTGPEQDILVLECDLEVLLQFSKPLCESMSKDRIVTGAGVVLGDA